jgi:hypothetical protein
MEKSALYSRASTLLDQNKGKWPALVDTVSFPLSIRYEEFIATSWKLQGSALLTYFSLSRVRERMITVSHPPVCLATYHPCVFPPTTITCHLCCVYRAIHCTAVVISPAYWSWCMQWMYRWGNRRCNWAPALYVYSFSDPDVAIMQFSPFSYYSLSIWSKYHPRTCVWSYPLLTTTVWLQVLKLRQQHKRDTPTAAGSRWIYVSRFLPPRVFCDGPFYFPYRLD